MNHLRPASTKTITDHHRGELMTINTHVLAFLYGAILAVEAVGFLQGNDPLVYGAAIVGGVLSFFGLAVALVHGSRKRKAATR